MTTKVDLARDGTLPHFTRLQGQYLAFIHTYTKLHRVGPAEADLQRYFQGHPTLCASNDIDACETGPH